MNDWIVLIKRFTNSLLAILACSTFPVFVQAEEVNGAASASSRSVPAEAYTEYAAAVTERLRGNLTAALVHLKAAQKLDTESFAIPRQMAEIYLQRGESKKAEQLLRQVIEKSPRDFTANLELGRINYQEDKFETAVKHLKIAVEVGPNQFYIRRILASIFRKTKKLLLAAQQYEKMLIERPSLNPTTRTLILLYRRMPKNMEALKSAARAPDADFISHFRLAQALGEKGKIQEAVSSLEMAVKLQPRWTHGLIMLGEYYQQLEQPELAINAYSRAADVAPGSNQLWDRLSQLFLNEHKFDDAARALERIRSLKPKNLRTLYQLCYCYYATGTYKSAIDAGEDYLRYSGKEYNSVIHEWLGKSYVKIGEMEKARASVNALLKRLEEEKEAAESQSISRLAASLLSSLDNRKQAIQLLEKTRKREPKDAETCLDLAYLYDQENLDEQAEKLLRYTLENHPDNPRVNNHLGYFYAERGLQLEEAVGLIKNALNQEPKNWAYLDSLGWVYFKMGRVQEALNKLNEAIRIHDDPIVREHLGDVYKAAGSPQKAKGQWERSLELDPDSESVKNKVRQLKEAPK